MHQIRLAIIRRPRPPLGPQQTGVPFYKQKKEMEIMHDYVWVVSNFLLWTLVPNEKKALCKLIM